MKINEYLLSVLVLMSLFLFSANIQGKNIPDSRPISEAVYIDSKQQLKIFSDALQMLYETGKMTKMKALSKQLSRKRCNIQLPEGREARLTPMSLYKQTKTAVLVVGYLYNCGKCNKWHASFATGFLVTPTGVMITNYHVVSNPKIGGIGVMTYNGKVYPVKEVLAADKTADIAVLQLEGSDFPYLSLLPGSPIGSKVWVISNPSNQLHVFTEGIISARSVTTRKKAKNQRISITADFGQGSSGAPVLEESGRVIGMVAGTQAVRDGNFTQMVIKHCIPAELILKLFAVKSKTNASKTDDAICTQVSEKAKRTSVIEATSAHSSIWFTSYDEAKAQAEKDNKKLFILFSDSERCRLCRNLKAVVLPSDAFLDYAKEKLVLFKADKALERKDKEGILARQNEKLMKKYPHRGVPSVFIAQKSGTVIGSTAGYLGESPKEYIEKRLKKYVE